MHIFKGEEAKTWQVPEKGITIELNGDSTKLEASLKSVSSEIHVL